MILTWFINVLAYPDNKAQSDDSSSNSKDVGVSSIYHVSTVFQLLTKINYHGRYLYQM